MHSPDEKKRKKQPVSTRFYELLEVTATADAETLRHSFLRLAKLHHPDRNAATAAAADSSIVRTNITSLFPSLVFFFANSL